MHPTPLFSFDCCVVVVVVVIVYIVHCPHPPLLYYPHHPHPYHLVPHLSSALSLSHILVDDRMTRMTRMTRTWQKNLKHNLKKKKVKLVKTKTPTIKTLQKYCEKALCGGQKIDRVN